MTPKRSTWLLLGVFGVLVCFFLAAPLLIIVPLSFTDAEEMIWPPIGFSTRWYETVLMSSDWRERIVTSLEIGMGSAALATALGLLAALGLVRGSFPGKRLVSALLLSPLVVPTVVIAIGMFFVWTLGWSIGPVTLGGELQGTVTGLILAHAVMNLPFPIIMITSALVTVDRNLERAAAIMGASPLIVFFRVTAPLIQVGILFGFVFAFLGSWDEYIVASFLSSAEVNTIPVGLFSQVKLSVDPTAAAVSSLLLAISSLVLGLMLLRGSRQLLGESEQR
ncbi:ABC transporter permease [Bradyrhizobium sp. WSM1253]|uniref:ABC transporter permease n=1 Tax=Bradyrhizobium sp. WSM1253 TaxID=319003 RepID=UPI00025D2960|nr:ABC transporter permease [Bradyrhizobium sp. WSM1253]EIG61340.1 ABC-type spermidine/putrescine transport system, permease component II [Bradyrhizobium sp. WSM1253]